MAIWQDATGGLHDDMGGEALTLPAWPQGMTQLTDAQAATVRAQQAAAIPPLPDPEGFEQAVKAGLGGILAANALAVAYPLFFAAVQTSVWVDVQTMVLDAQGRAAINATQYAAIKAAATQFNIPINLP